MSGDGCRTTSRSGSSRVVLTFWLGGFVRAHLKDNTQDGHAFKSLDRACSSLLTGFFEITQSRKSLYNENQKLIINVHKPNIGHVIE